MLTVCLLVVASIPGLAAATAMEPETSTQTNLEVDVIVVFQSPERVNETAITDLGGTVTGGRSLTIVPAIFARIDYRAFEALRAHPDVRRVEYDRQVEVPSNHSVGELSTEDTVPWGIERIGARAAAADVPDGAEANVTVAVLDTGVDYDHQDLDSSVVWGVDVVGSTEYGLAAADDVDGHGTHVAGTIAGRENSIGVVGTAPNVQIYSIQVLGSDGGRTSDIVQGIDEALKGPDGEIGTPDDADVISMSLGGEFGTVSEREAIARANNQSVPVVVAAGNSGDGNLNTDEVAYPAKYEDAIAVAATDPNGEVPVFSSEGPAVEIAAPGVHVLSTFPDDRYVRFSGTSMATGHVSGTVALMIAQDSLDGDRDLSIRDIRNHLATTAQDLDPPGKDNASGAGLLRTDKAVDTAGVQPQLVRNRSEVVVGDTVEFYVVRGDDGRQLSATVTAEGETYGVNETTAARHTFDTAGVFSVTATVQTETGFEYIITTNVTVSPGDLTNDGLVATTGDDDERFNDVNGDGTVNVVDVQALFANLDDTIVQNNPDSFDFNGDGVVNVVDVQRLFVEISEADETAVG